jgi:hypothetical protein
MKLFCVFALFLSFSAMSNEIKMTKSEYNLGNISDKELNRALFKRFVLFRTPSTPETVTLKYKINYLKEECVSFESKKTEVTQDKRTVCQGDKNGYTCEEKTYTDLFTAEVVCAQKGLIREEKDQEVTLNFKKAVALAPKASEVFAVILKQTDMKNDSTEAVGLVLESSSLYDIKKPVLGIGKSVVFKAQ